jgi:hypothetical protein
MSALLYAPTPTEHQQGGGGEEGECNQLTELIESAGNLRKNGSPPPYRVSPFSINEKISFL